MGRFREEDAGFQTLRAEQPQGINLTREEVQLDPRVWTDAIDVQFEHGITKKVYGYEEGFGTSRVVPDVIVPLRDDTQEFYWWAYVGMDSTPATKIYRVVSEGNHFDATPSDPMGPEWYPPEPFPLTGLEADKEYRWTGDTINGVPYLVYGIPYFYNTVTQLFEASHGIPRFDLQSGDPDYDDMVPANNWNRGEPRVRFKNIRTYQNFMIGMNFETDEFATGNFENGYGPWKEGIHQSAIWWSDAIIGKDVDVNWKDADPNEFSGWNFLGGPGGPIIDGKSMRDSFVIYRERSVWQMTYIGGTSIFAFKELFNDAGMLGQDCVAEIEGRHLVVGQSDIYIHDGVMKKSVVDGTLREELFRNIDPSHTDKVFIATDYKNKEVIVCIPAVSGDSIDDPLVPYEAGKCNLGYVFNWERGTWSKRRLPNVVSSAYTLLDLPEQFNFWTPDPEGGWLEPNGPAKFPDAPGVTWGEAPDTWASSEYTYNPAQWGLVWCSHEASGKLYTYNEKTLLNGQSFEAEVEKTYMDMGDRLQTKYVARILPQVRNGVVEVWGGATMGLDEGINWGSRPIGTFDPARDTHLACRLNGRYIHLRFIIPENSNAEIRGWWVEWDGIGRR